MFSNTQKEWLTYLSERDEFRGGQARAPITAIKYHISKEFDNFNKTQTLNSEKISEEISSEIQNSTTLMEGALDRGFSALLNSSENISFNLENINKSLDSIEAVLSWGFSEVVEQIRASNILLENIAELLKIPEFQKESEAYIKEGLKYFRNAEFNKKRYNDALENFLLAEKKANTNYFLLQKIGLIYLFSVDNLNINLALEYFLKAADYSLDETYNFASITRNELEKDVSIIFNKQDRKIVDIKKHTAYSYMYAGRCYYILEDYDKALIYAKKAFNLFPSSIFNYDIAKYYSKLNKIDDALEIIINLIKENKNFFNKIQNDYDLESKKKIKNYLDELSLDTIKKLNKYIIKFDKPINHSQLKGTIIDLKNYAKKETYINARIGIEKYESHYDYAVRLIRPIDAKKNIYSTEWETINTTPINCYNYLVFSHNKIETLKERFDLNKKHTVIKERITKYNTSLNDLKIERKGNQYGLLFILLGVLGVWWVFYMYEITYFVNGLIWTLLLAVPVFYAFVYGFTSIVDYLEDTKRVNYINKKLIPLKNQLTNLEIEISKINKIINDYDLSFIKQVQ